jgi:hypothetical protein
LTLAFTWHGQPQRVQNIHFAGGGGLPTEGQMRGGLFQRGGGVAAQPKAQAVGGKTLSIRPT